jgi:hypothetical protein
VTLQAGGAVLRERFFHLTMLGATTAMLSLALVGCGLAGISIPFAEVLPRLGVLAATLAVAAFYAYRREERLHNLAIFAFWNVLVTNLYLFPMYAVARLGTADGDSLLARLDAGLGLTVPRAMALVSHPALKLASDVSYAALIFLLLAAIMAPPLFGRVDRAKEYLIGMLVAGALGVLIFAFFQAVGPWYHYGFRPNDPQAVYEKTLFLLKGEGGYQMSFRDPAGLVTFPSFHVITSVLAAVALWPLRYVGKIGAVVAALVCASTVTTGWHYVADVWGGLLLVPVAVYAGRLYTRLERRLSPAR